LIQEPSHHHCPRPLVGNLLSFGLQQLKIRANPSFSGVMPLQLVSL
jgi:hypothetical protein